MTVAFSSKAIEQFNLAKAIVQKATITGVSTLYVALIPGYHTTITINKTGSTGTLKMSNDYTKGGDVDDAIFGEEQSSGTDDYHKGSTTGFTGCEIDITTYAADVEVVILQFVIGN